MNTNSNPEIFKLISFIYRKYGMLLDSELKKINISRGEYPFLACLYNNRSKNLNQNEISKILGVDRAHTNRYFKKLANLNYIIETKCKQNKRISYVHLTPSGEEKAKEIMILLENFSNNILSNLEDFDLNSLNENLTKLEELLTFMNSSL